METTADAVLLPPGSLVAQFRNAVHCKNSLILTSVMSSQLLVYKNNTAFNKRTDPNDPDGVPLDPTQPLYDGLGALEDALIIVVPSSRISSRSTYISSLTGKETNPAKRKQRWIDLNEVLVGNSKKSRQTIQQHLLASPGIKSNMFSTKQSMFNQDEALTTPR